MGLLDGGLKSIIGSVFGDAVFLAGLIHVPTRTEDAGGSISTVFTGDVGQPDATACRAIAIDYSERERDEGGYGEKDVSIMVLQSGLSVEIDEGFEVTVMKPGTSTPQRYKVATPIVQDPAGATWTMRGTPA